MDEKNWNYLTKRRGDSGDSLTVYKLLTVTTGQRKQHGSVWPEMAEPGLGWEQ